MPDPLEGDARGVADVQSEFDAPADDDGGELSEEALAELAALAEAEATAAAEPSAERIAELEARLVGEHAGRRAAVARVRDAVLAAEPELPPELVSGETLEELDASLEAARRAVAQIRERLTAEAERRGFPVGSPERRGPTTEGLTASEKIAFGLERQHG